MRPPHLSMDSILDAFLSLETGNDGQKTARSLAGWTRAIRVREISPTKIQPADSDAATSTSVSAEAHADARSDFYELIDPVLTTNSAYSR